MSHESQGVIRNSRHTCFTCLYLLINATYHSAKLTLVKCQLHLRNYQLFDSSRDGQRKVLCCVEQQYNHQSHPVRINALFWGFDGR